MALGFLSGSIPFGLLIARSKGVDIRKVGSGNIGATNVGRALGKKYFYLCFVLDFFKGCIPSLVAGIAMGQAGLAGSMSAGQASWWLGVVVATVLGHVFSPWIGFKGGKGIATGLGALAGVFPFLTVPAACLYATWLVARYTWGYVSLASVIATVSLPFWIAAWAVAWARIRAGEASTGWSVAGSLANAVPFIVCGAVLTVLVVWTHRANLRRIRAGTEPKAGAPAKV